MIFLIALLLVIAAGQAARMAIEIERKEWYSAFLNFTLAFNCFFSATNLFKMLGK